MIKYSSSTSKTSGFTLIELLIVIGILTVLAAVAIIIINPAQMIKQSRDSNRMAELNSLNRAFSIYQAFGGSSLGTPNTIYISLPDSDPQCGSYYNQLAATTSPWVYKCAPLITYRNTDGTGWIPVDFTSIQSQAGSLFATLPVDPINTVSDNLYYTYIPGGSWALSATMESDKYLTSIAASEGGFISTRFEVGSDLALNANLPNCGAGPIVYAGQSYRTILIGKQCWFQQNLDYDNGCSLITWVNNTDVGWCGYYTGGPFANEGLLYQWSAAMNNSTTAGARGVCPTGWHIPTHDEWTTLERSICTSTTCTTDFPYDLTTTDWRGTNEGTALKAGGTSGFNGLLAGVRGTDGLFSDRTLYTGIWSSVDSRGNAWVRYLTSGYVSMYRGTDSKALGFSVRCLKN